MFQNLYEPYYAAELERRHWLAGLERRRQVAEAAGRPAGPSGAWRAVSLIGAALTLAVAILGSLR